jgi:IclR family mhp operon transcriptional activator
MDESQEIKSLKKALNALTFMNQEGEATVASLACAISVPRTTASRLLETLASEGYVERAPNSRFYRLTSQVLRLSSGFQRENQMIEAAAPLLMKLGREVGWSISLSTPKASDMIVRLTTNFETSMVLDRFAVGYRVPIIYTTTGLCFLALCSEPERRAVLDLARQSRDPRQKLAHNPARLEGILTYIRDCGFISVEHPEHREGNVGVPLMIHGRVVGGIVMRYIKSAMRLEKMLDYYVPRLKELSHEVQQECEVRLSDNSGHRAGVMDFADLDLP